MAELELDNILRRYTDPKTGSVHGATFFAVDHTGKELYKRSFGTRTLDGCEPLTPDALTWLASASKLVSSVAGMQMVEQGRIGLDDDVRPFLPALKAVKVLLGWEDGDDDLDAYTLGSSKRPKGNPVFEDVKGSITLRQLMSHTCGLSYDKDGLNPLVMKWSAWSGRTDDMYSGTVESITYPLICQPGTRWVYGVGLDWVCQLVEALTGQDFESYMQDKIWKPLSAPSTTYRPARHFGKLKWPSLMQEMAQRQSDGTYTKAGFPWHSNPQAPLGGIGLFSTANDYAKLLGALVSGGGPLLSAESVREMLRPQDLVQEASDSLQDFVFGKPYGLDRHLRTSDVPLAPPPLVQQSLAGTVTTEDVPGRRKKGSVNWGGNPNIIWWIDPESGVAAGLFTQLRPSFPSNWMLGLDLEDAVYRFLQSDRRPAEQNGGLKNGF